MGGAGGGGAGALQGRQGSIGASSGTISTGGREDTFTQPNGGVGGSGGAPGSYGSNGTTGIGYLPVFETIIEDGVSFPVLKLAPDTSGRGGAPGYAVVGPHTFVHRGAVYGSTVLRG